METVAVADDRGREREPWWGPVAFVLICFGYSWGLWSLMILSARHKLPFNFPTLPFGALGPAIAGVSLVLCRHGRAGFKLLLKHLVQWPERWAFYVFAIVSMPAIYALSCLSYVLISRTGMPQLENLNQWYMVFPLGLYILVFGGPFWEEVGWRGYLLPALQQRLHPLVSSLIVGLIWATWHVPGFWLDGSAQQGASMAPFFLTTIAMSVLFTWVYNSTHGSLAVAVVYHFFVNITSFTLGLAAPSILEAELQNRLFLGIVCAVAIAVILITKGSLGQPRLGAETH